MPRRLSVRTMRMFLAKLILLLMAIPALGFPAIPSSIRILTADEVQNYWFNIGRRVPAPRKPSALYPEQVRQWQSKQAARRSYLQSILNGRYREEALMAALEHNIEAWLLLDEPDKAAAARIELTALRESRARIAMANAERDRSNRMARAAERTAQAAEDAAQAAEDAASAAEDCEPTPIIVVRPPTPCPPSRPPISPPCPPSIPLPPPPPRPYCPTQ